MSFVSLQALRSQLQPNFRQMVGGAFLQNISKISPKTMGFTLKMMDFRVVFMLKMVDFPGALDDPIRFFALKMMMNFA